MRKSICVFDCRGGGGFFLAIFLFLSIIAVINLSGIAV